MKRNAILMSATGSIFLFCLPISVIWGDADTICVSESAIVYRKADIAYISLYVSASDESAADVADEVADKSKSIKSYLEKRYKDIIAIDILDLGVEKRINPMWSDKSQRQRPKTQLMNLSEVMHLLRISIPPDKELAYEIIDTAQLQGALLGRPSSSHYGTIYGSALVYGLSDASDAEKEARKKAFENAKKSARETAELAGRRIGDVISFECGGEQCVSGPIPPHWNVQNFPAKYLASDSASIRVQYGLIVTFQVLD